MCFEKHSSVLWILAERLVIAVERLFKHGLLCGGRGAPCDESKAVGDALGLRGVQMVEMATQSDGAQRLYAFISDFSSFKPLR